MLDLVTFKEHLTGLVEQSASPFSSSQSNIQANSARFIIAYSGGLDSHVLLHLMHACQFNCHAVYIDHGLQLASKGWADHCSTICDQLNIPFQSVSVNAKAAKGESPEASARTARYQALANLMQAGDVLLTAQHCQDQSETLLLQMLRTSGPAGLAAMPAAKIFATGVHIRPLLSTDRADLEAYAKHHHLKWVEDPTNTDQRYDRNFFRQAVFPLLKKRWPSINQTLSNVCSLQAEANELMNDLAAIDAEKTIDGNTLTISVLLKLSATRQRNLVRYWLQQCQLDAPTAKRLKEILGSMITAADDKMPVVDWSNTEVRRFQGKLYAMKTMQSFSANQQLEWNGQQALVLPDLNKAVFFENITSDRLAEMTFSIRFRQGGEKIKPSGRAYTMDLKKLMQQAAIPPWERSRLPLLYLDDKLVAVADYWMTEDFENLVNQPSLLLKTRNL